MKVLITGGAGFIGSNLAAYHLKLRDKVIIYDNLSREGAKQNLVWLKSIKPSCLEANVADIRDKRELQKAVGRAEIIFHLAGQVAVTRSIEDPYRDFEINVLGTLSLLEASRSARHRPIIIYSSTNKVYGQLKNISKPISEKQALDFNSPYACSKGAADQYVLAYARTYGLPTAVFRQSCVYGPRQFGDEDQGWVAHFVTSALLKKPIVIYGDGRQVRDILEIDDLVNAFQLARKNIKNCHGQAFNIGGGEKNKISLLELIDFLEKKTGRKITLSFSKARLGDQQYYVSDLSKAKRVLGWQPQVSKIQGLNKLLHELPTSAPGSDSRGRSGRLEEKNLLNN